MAKEYEITLALHRDGELVEKLDSFHFKAKHYEKLKDDFWDLCDKYRKLNGYEDNFDDN